MPTILLPWLLILCHIVLCCSVFGYIGHVAWLPWKQNKDYNCAAKYFQMSLNSCDFCHTWARYKVMWLGYHDNLRSTIPTKLPQPTINNTCLPLQSCYSWYQKSTIDCKCNSYRGHWDRAGREKNATGYQAACCLMTL